MRRSLDTTYPTLIQVNKLVLLGSLLLTYKTSLISRKFGVMFDTVNCLRAPIRFNTSNNTRINEFYPHSEEPEVKFSRARLECVAITWLLRLRSYTVCKSPAKRLAAFSSLPFKPLAPRSVERYYKSSYSL